MDSQERIAALEARVADLERQLTAVADVQAIERLQHQYGYYLDKCLYEEVVDLFAGRPAGEPEVRFLRGVYRGREGIRRLFLGRFMKRWAAGRNGPAYGHLLDHPQLQPVIHVAPDGLTAQGRFRTLMMLGVHESAAATHEAGTFQRWESALYENRYVKQDGGWRIAVIDLRHAWLCTYERGWAYSPIWEDYVSVCYPEDPDGPDEIAADDWRMWPDTRVLPFHYPHPVTGQWVLPTSGAAPAPE
ncbi:MAG: nuclear transport factor 2 family protein [Chloroflexi bacterium]|nr:MAG: nuclear transport factor 2 family protein [Chloroflexota bacterium]